MKFTKLTISDVVLIEPILYEDNRGSFMESFNLEKYSKFLPKSIQFVQDNHSISSLNVLRGLHYQINHPQDKLVRVVSGSVFDVAVDLRKSSPTFGMWVGEELSEKNNKQLFIPKGFAHGFIALTDNVNFLYKTSEYYYPDDERTIIWNDIDLNICWPVNNPIISKKDANSSRFKDADYFE